MEVYISNSFTKAHNSTKQGDYTGWTKYEVVRLKQPCNIINPSLELSSFIPNACYAYIPAFNRYYFINNVESVVNGIWLYNFSVDAMGTYKSDIIGSTQYCSRSSAGNTALHDGLITHAETNPTVTKSSINMGFGASCFVLEVTGKSGVQLYALDRASLTSLIVNLFNDSFYGQSVVDDTVKTYFNPFQYILSCRWFPIGIGTGGTPINFGWWNGTATGQLLEGFGGSDVYNTFNASVSLPKIDDTNNFYNFESNWIRYNLYIPGCGDIEIPAFYAGQTLDIWLTVDYWTGQANAEVRTSNSGVIGRLSGQLGVDVRLSNLSSDISNIGSTILFANESDRQGLYDTMSNPQKSVGASIGAAIYNAIDGILPGDPVKTALQPNLAVTTASGNSIYLSAKKEVELTTTYYTPYNLTSVNDKFNKVDNTYRSLSSLSGYTICESPKIEINGTIEEKNLITSFMRGGFYIE